MGVPPGQVFGTYGIVPSSTLANTDAAAQYGINPPAALATRTSVSINTATITAVQFDVEVFDNGSFFAPTSAIFTVPDRGFYNIIGNGTWGTISATGYRLLMIYQNATEIAGQEGPGDASASIRQTVAASTLCSAGDTIELRAFHTLGVAQNLTNSRLGVVRLSGT